MIRFNALILTAAMAVSPLALAGEGPRGPWWLSERAADKLTLNEAQRSQIRNLWENHRAVYPADRDLKKQKRESLKALVTTSPFDREQARELLQSDTERRLAELELRHDIHQLLNADQRETLKQMRERRHQHREKRGPQKHRHH